MTTLLAKVKALRAEFDGKKVAPTTWERNGRIFVSAEDGGHFADYYGEFRGGYSWIHPSLERLAQEADGFWEWENPGCLVFCT